MASAGLARPLGQLAQPVRAQPLVIPARSSRRAREANTARVPRGTDLVEWYFEQGWTDGLPVVAPTPEAVDAAVAALGGDPDFVECRVPPRPGSLTRRVLSVDCVRDV